MRKGPLGWIRRLAGRGEFDCDDVVENCSDYVDGELSQPETAKLVAHLEECPDCPKFVSTFRATVNSLRALEQRTPERDRRERIRGSIAAEAGDQTDSSL